MKRSERYQYILGYFSSVSPNVTTELEFGSAFQLLVATVLSAQCTDKRVNQVTPDLFLSFPNAKAMSQTGEDEILSYISSISYPNSKARHLLELSKKLVEKYEGEVPSTFDELVSLPGVGRKTANVMLAVAFSTAAIPVDTHVYRVSHRLGLVPLSANTPYLVEKYLSKNIPSEMQSDAHHWLLLHGRYVCTSRKPHCGDCPFSDFCPKIMDFKNY